MSRPPMPPAHGGQPMPMGHQGPGPSFKTNVNRNKTRKWAEARHINYDGDDWDGRDPYGEYGTYDKPRPSFSPRNHSYEERRAFSASGSPSRGRYDPALDPPQAPYAGKPRSGSHDSRGPRSMAYQQDFYRPPPVPQHSHLPPGDINQWAPSSTSETIPDASVPFRDASVPSDEKPAAVIPFIRPSDIYKRMQQDQGRDTPGSPAQAEGRDRSPLQEVRSSSDERSTVSSTPSTQPTIVLDPPRTTETTVHRTSTDEAPTHSQTDHVPATATPTSQAADMSHSTNNDRSYETSPIRQVPHTEDVNPSAHQVSQNDNSGFGGHIPTTGHGENPIPTIIEEPASPQNQVAHEAATKEENTSPQLSSAEFPWLGNDAENDTAESRADTVHDDVPQHKLAGRSTIIPLPKEDSPAASPDVSQLSDPNWTAIASPPTGHEFESISAQKSKDVPPPSAESNWTAIASPATAHQFEDAKSGDSASSPAQSSDPAPAGSGLRPLHVDRIVPSNAGSVPPTPPAKDTPKHDSHKLEEEYFETAEDRPRANSFSESDEHEFTESDRLREDIVRSLTPAAPTKSVDAPAPDDVTPGAHVTLRDEPQTSNPGQQGAATHPVRPELIEQRFSWENRESAFFNPSALGSEVDLPHGNLRTVNAEPDFQSPETATAKEPPRLLTTDIPSATLGDTGVSPASSSSVREGRPSLSSEYPPNSALSDTRAGPNDWPSVEEYAKLAAVPESPSNDSPGAARIPPFREILAIKNGNDRISSYNTTRKQFADMDTGLRSWLTTTMATRPEHNHLNIAGPTLIPGGAVPNSIRHRPGESIVKLARKGLGTSNRSDSVTNSGGDNAQHANVEKMQAMGKDLLSSAGKLGGKGVVGAKGWIAKGRQKLRETSSGGGDKTNPPTSTPPTAAAPHTWRPSDEQPHNSQPTLPREASHLASEQDTRVTSQSAITGTTPESGTDEATASVKPKLQKRNSSRRSSRRLSATFDRILSNVSELSRTRSKSQSLVLSSTEALQGMRETGLEPGSDTTERVGLSENFSGQGSDKATPWSTETSGAETPGYMQHRHLGVLPSPVSESFTEVSDSPDQRPTTTPKPTIMNVDVGAVAPQRSSRPVPTQKGEAETLADKERTNAESQSPKNIAGLSNEADRDRATPDDIAAQGPGEHVNSIKDAQALQSESSMLEIPELLHGHKRELTVSSEISLTSDGAIEQPEVLEIVRVKTPLPTASGRLPNQSVVEAESTPSTAELPVDSQEAIGQDKAQTSMSNSHDGLVQKESNTETEPHSQRVLEADTTSMHNVGADDGPASGANERTVLSTIPEPDDLGNTYEPLEQPSYPSPPTRILPWSDSPGLGISNHEVTLAALEGAGPAERAYQDDQRYEPSRRFSFGAEELLGIPQGGGMPTSDAGRRSLSQPLGGLSNTARPAPSVMPTPRAVSDNQMASRGKLVKKDKRASLAKPLGSSSGAGPDVQSSPAPEKKKRFSGLGSLFGRSSSNAVKETAATSKRNRLSKQVPVAAVQQREPSPSKSPALPSFEPHVRPSDQAMLADDDSHPRSHTPLSRRSSMHASPLLNDTISPIWAGPQERVAEPTIPNFEPTRRLHSARPAMSNRHSYAGVADHFQPTDASAPSPNVDRSRWERSSGGTQSHRSNSASSKRVAWSFEASEAPEPQPSHGSGNLSRRTSSYTGQRDESGYFIPQPGRSSPFSPFRQTSTERRPGQQSRSSSSELYRGRSAPQSQRSSVYSTDGMAVMQAETEAQRQSGHYTHRAPGEEQLHDLPMQSGASPRVGGFTPGQWPEGLEGGREVELAAGR